ncbi:hypothetical protein GOV14_04675, partial [Candidatus Pacearchaeota archaeon]|nr:hypothetical protein [Candidatus Pacearchaeota archaeon]
ADYHDPIHIIEIYNSVDDILSPSGVLPAEIINIKSAMGDLKTQNRQAQLYSCALIY